MALPRGTLGSVARGVVLLGCAGLTGCGGSEQGPPTSVAQEFYAAVASQDGEGACAVLAPTTRSQLEESAGAACTEAVLDEDLPAAGDPLGTQVFGTMAQVRYAAETAFLTRVDGGWRVLAAGCGAAPTGADRPFDCRVEGG